VSVAVAALVVAVPDAPAGSPVPCNDRSWTAFTVEWCDGALVYRDAVYDDRGADTGALEGAVAPWTTTGDVDHRASGQSLNSTDLLALRLARHGNRIDVAFELNTLLPGDGTIAALAVDLDADGGPRTGWDPIALQSEGFDALYTFDERDAVANSITGSIPLPSATSVRVQAVVALADGTPMNVAFRLDERGMWWEDAQAAELADGDLDADGLTFRVADLGRLHLPAPPPAPGLHERVFTSAYPQGEGVVPDGIANDTTALFHFVGAHQPYALYVPHSIGQLGAQLVLHGSSENHSQLVSLPGMQLDMSEHTGRLLVSPLGRGPTNSWVDWAARDALDALDDASALFGTDPDHVVVSGYSMGGGGTMWLSTLFPDRFGAAIAWNGFTGDCLAGTPLAQGLGRPDELDALDSNDPAQRSGCPLGTRGNSVDYFGNLRHIPIGFLFGAADEVVWPNHALAAFDAIDGLGYVHKTWVHTSEHLSFPRLDEWQKEAEWAHGRRVVRNPARVTYRTNAWLYKPELDLVPDGAYWVDDLRPIDDSLTPEGDMVVDLMSGRCATRAGLETEQVHDAGAAPVPWVGIARVPTSIVPPASGNTITGTLTNVASITIDRSDACFAPGEEILLDIDTDDRTVITIRD
jgi:poly(3-hydroxybutyrate) depolymerase